MRYRGKFIDDDGIEFVNVDMSEDEMIWLASNFSPGHMFSELEQHKYLKLGRLRNWVHYLTINQTLCFTRASSL